VSRGLLRSNPRSGLLALLILALLAFPATRADADPVARGKTGLKQREGVELSRLEPARVKGRTIALPIDSGLLVGGSGYLFHRGGLKLVADGGTLRLTNFILNTEKGWLSAKLDGKRLKLATVESAKSKRDGFGSEVTVGDIELTARAARLLNRGLGLQGVFDGGKPFASALISARFEVLTISGGAIYFTLDDAFRAKLQSLGIAVSPFEATWVFSQSPLTYALPDIAGSAAIDLSSGGIGSQNGLRLTQGEGGEARVVSLLGIWLGFDSKVASADLRSQPSGTGGVAPFATVGFSTVHANPTTGVISIPNTPAALSPQLAVLLNEAFGQPRGQPAAFSTGEPLGEFAFMAQTR
jgi:hypothetical protein